MHPSQTLYVKYTHVSMQACTHARTYTDTHVHAHHIGTHVHAHHTGMCVHAHAHNAHAHTHACTDIHRSVCTNTSGMEMKEQEGKMWTVHGRNYWKSKELACFEMRLKRCSVANLVGRKKGDSCLLQLGSLGFEPASCSLPIWSYGDGQVFTVWSSLLQNDS